jgi:hypothetical protein
LKIPKPVEGWNAAWPLSILLASNGIDARLSRWRRNGPVVDEVLDLVPEADALIGMMTGVLVVAAVDIRIMGKGKVFWQFFWFKRFDEVSFEKFLIDGELGVGELVKLPFGFRWLGFELVYAVWLLWESRWEIWVMVG